MTTSDIHTKAIQIGRETDLVQRNNSDAFPDSVIIYARKGRVIHRAAAAIDIDSFSLYFAKTVLTADLAIAHHPISKAANAMPTVLLEQIATLASYDAHRETIQEFIRLSSAQLKRQIAGDNYYQEEQIARLLDIDVMTVHTPCDNAAVSLLKKAIKEYRCKTLIDAVNAFSDIYEFKTASLHGQAPFIAYGKKDDLLGAISFSEFVGGQESSPAIFAPLKKAGIDTLIVPHLSEQFFKEARKNNLRIIYCGHLASDSLGMNYFLDQLEGIKIVPLGGLIRKDNPS